MPGATNNTTTAKDHEDASYSFRSQHYTELVLLAEPIDFLKMDCEKILLSWCEQLRKGQQIDLYQRIVRDKILFHLISNEIFSFVFKTSFFKVKKVKNVSKGARLKMKERLIKKKMALNEALESLNQLQGLFFLNPAQEIQSIKSWIAEQHGSLEKISARLSNSKKGKKEQDNFQACRTKLFFNIKTLLEWAAGQSSTEAKDAMIPLLKIFGSKADDASSIEKILKERPHKTARSKFNQFYIRELEIIDSDISFDLLDKSMALNLLRKKLPNPSGKN